MNLASCEKAIADMEDQHLKYDPDDILEEIEANEAVVEKKWVRPKIKAGYRRIEEMPAQHIRLFAPWLMDRKMDFYEVYDGVMDEEDFQLLNDALDQDTAYDSFRCFFRATLHILGTDEKAQKVMIAFMDRTPYGAEIKDKILFDHKVMHEDSFFIYYEKLLNNPLVPNNLIDRIAVNMNIDIILESLKISTEAAYRQIYSDFENFKENGDFFGCWKTRCHILLRLITSKPKKHLPHHWYFEFLKACDSDPETRAIPYVMEKQWKELVEEYERIITQLTKPKFKPNADFADPEFIPRKPRPQKDFGPYPDAITGDYSQNYELREYQKELTLKAKEGISTIICAPTGSGKTHVAADIITYHLRQKNSAQDVRRVAMFVPTVPLVQQQWNHLSQNLNPEFYVEKLSGVEKCENAEPRQAKNILKADIVVLTPQIFINMLLSPLKSQKIYVHDFTMFVFDECHHCNEGHPYNVLMNFVRENADRVRPKKKDADGKVIDENEPDEKVEYFPQIVGLTASVGIGSDSAGRLDAHAALEHMIGLCARLNVDTVSSVTDPMNLKEMQYHVSQPIDDIISLKHSERDDFANEVALMSDYVYDQILPVLKDAVADSLEMEEKHIELPKETANSKKNGTTKTTARYNGKLGFMKHMIIKYENNAERRHFLVRYIELLEILHFTLKNNEIFPASLAFEYLLDRIHEVSRSQNFHFDQENAESMLEVYKAKLVELRQFIEGKFHDLEQRVHDSNKKPILTKLFEEIQDQYRIDKNSRIIIFVESRKGCNRMAQFLNKSPEIVNTFGPNKVGFLVSVNQSKANFGQSAVSQTEILRKFRDGQINIIVATSVAEEGLDIQKCNLIIKYNNVGSETAYIQRRGRARAKNSRSVLLALSAAVQEQEYHNIMREFLMNACLTQLQLKSEMELKNLIAKKKDEILRAMKQEKEDLEKQKSQNKEFMLKCSRCDTEICKSYEVARLMDSNFICCNPRGWQKTSIEPRYSKNMSSVALLCGEWMCSCGQKRGEVIKYGEAYLPSLSAEGFILYEKTYNNAWQQVEMAKKFLWSNITAKFFVVGPITSNQIREMINSLQEYNEKAFNEAQMNEQKVIAESLKTHDKFIKKMEERQYRLRED